MNTEAFYPFVLQCNKVTIDSRAVEKNDIFFAFSSERFNAAATAQEAIENGALAVIVEQKEYENIASNIFYVPSTLLFLQEIAKYHRNRLQFPVIALTGSNGKTTTKELIHAVLSQKFNTQYTFGNLNNHIGVPLTLLSIKPEHEMAVIEMGANHQKEIELLCEIAQPDIGYITNFGKAHLEGFGGFSGVIKGKSELYDFMKDDNKTILVNENDSIQVEKTSGYHNKITFGTPESDYYFEQFSQDHSIGIEYKGEKILSNLTGNYNFSNLCAAASLGLYFGVSVSRIKNAVEQYMPTNMRSQIVEKNDQLLVLDTYNANPSSMVEALKNFQSFEGSKTIIIGDMLELGEESLHEHTSILEIARDLGFDEIITVGKHFSETGISEKSYENTEALISAVKNQPILSKNILLKASRGIALERILEYI